MIRSLCLLGALVIAAGCSASSAPVEPATTAAAKPSSSPTGVRFNKLLHDELIGMATRDQDERTGGPLGEGDEARTARLAEIIDEYGWPTIDLVGKDGEDAAWLIAQHSDLDLEFQEDALELLREAVAADQASAGNLAYLEDRVAVARHEPQTYGTQIRCGPHGPVPSTPINDRSGVERRRAEAGLDPLRDYLAEMKDICVQE